MVLDCLGDKGITCLDQAQLEEGATGAANAEGHKPDSLVVIAAFA